MSRHGAERKVNVPGSLRRFPLLLRVRSRWIYTRQCGVTPGLASPAAAARSLRTLPGRGAAAGRLHRPAALRHPRRSRGRRAPSAAAATARCRAALPARESRGSAGSVSALTSGGSPGMGFSRVGTPGRSRRGRRAPVEPGALPALPGGGGAAASDFAPAAKLFLAAARRNPGRASFRGGTSSHGAQPRDPSARKVSAAPLPLPLTLLPLLLFARPEGRSSAPTPQRCRPGGRSLSSGRAALAAPRSSASRLGCITPLI